jgi:pimeloyl-ACP methyl ester carboxylesterase
VPAECAVVHAPYTWDDPGGATLDLFVKRYRTAGSHGQLWFVQGGPGGSSREFDPVAEYFAQLGIGFDYYMMDERGTGLSTRLGCSAQEAPSSDGGVAITPAEWPACIAAMQVAFEPALAGFTVSNTARDLGELIATLHDPDRPASVYGVSYGPYVVNRYLQLYPEQPASVVLDSICGPGNCAFSAADAKFDTVARAFLDGCSAEATCAAHLGPDASSKLAAIYAQLDAGACPAATAAGLTRTTLRHAFAQMLYHWDQRVLIPPIAYRLGRCAAKDIPVLQHFGAVVNAPATVASLEGFSTALAFHIGLSELWDDPSPGPDAYRTQEAMQLISNGVGARMSAVHDAWPRTPHDAYFGSWATTTVPMLLLGGSLDPATPLAYEHGAMTAFAGPNQTFVSVPRAGHNVLVESPATTNARPCGLTLFLQFVAQPTAALDTACVSTVLPLEFTYTSTAAAALIGTTDLWGDS